MVFSYEPLQKSPLWENHYEPKLPLGLEPPNPYQCLYIKLKLQFISLYFVNVRILTFFLTSLLFDLGFTWIWDNFQTISFTFWVVQAVVTIYNFQQYRHIQAPGWTLGWTWSKKEVVWSMVGGQTTDQGDCSRYKGNIPHCCRKDPTVVDLLPGTPYNQQIANCCKGGVMNSWVQDPANAASSFQISVGAAGTTNKTVRLPKNFTLRAPGPGYTCGPAKIVRPSKFVSDDKRRVTQALSKLLAKRF
jgi:hypothetical protein